MKVYVGSPIYHYYEVEAAMAMRGLVMHCFKMGISLIDDPQIGPGLIQARNMAAARFLRSDADVFLAIDADITFQPEDAIKLCLKAQENGIVGALYVKRLGNHGSPVYFFDGDTVVFEPDARLHEVEYLAGGFMAISRKVFEGIRDFHGLELLHGHEVTEEDDRSYWDFFSAREVWHESSQGRIHEQEDWAFCGRAKEAGFKSWLDPSIRLGHIGQYVYTVEDLLMPGKPTLPKFALKREGHVLKVMVEE